MRGVEADELVEEAKRRVGRLVGIDGCEAEAGVVVDRDVQVLPAGTVGSSRAITGDSMAGPYDPAQLLDVDVHELTWTGALVADDLLARRAYDQPRASVPAKHSVHGRGRDTEGPTDDVRSFAQLISRAQNRLLDCRGRAPGRAQWAARAVTKRLTSAPPVDPLRRRLPGAADDERGRGDRQSSANQITDTLTLTNGQNRISVKIHKSPPLGRDSLTSRTLGGLTDASRRQQRVWDIHLGPATDERTSLSLPQRTSARHLTPGGTSRQMCCYVTEDRARAEAMLADVLAPLLDRPAEPLRSILPIGSAERSSVAAWSS